MKKQSRIIILANAFVSSKSIGGGDRFIMEVSPTLAKATRTTIITSKVGYHHWQRLTRIIPAYARATAGKLVNAHFQVLKPTLFDDRDHPLAIMLAYLIRSIQTTSLLRKKAPTHLVTASQLLPDVVPAYLMKRSHSNLRWIARLYHLVPPPTTRVGNPLVNTVVYLLQGLLILLLRSADLIVADNPQTVTELRKQGFPANQLKMLPSGIPYQEIAQHKPRQRWSFDAAYIGRLDPHKGIFDLLEIWQTVTSKIPDGKLAIAGYGSHSTTKKLKQEFHAKRLQNNVQFLGFLPDEENGKSPLYDLLKSIKLLLFTDHEAGFGFVVAEAMAAGVPVVAYDLPSFYTTYKKGFLTAPLRDPKTFAKQALALLNDEEKRSRLGKEAQAEARRYDIRRVAHRFTLLVLH